MRVINRGSVTAPVLPEKIVSMPSLGEDAAVRVRCFDLDGRLAFGAKQTEQRALRRGETDADAQTRVGAWLVAELLALTAIDDEGKPVFTADQWRAHGATHTADVMRAFNVAWRLCGFDAEAVEKN